MNTINYQKGFGMNELIVVVGILVILLAIAMPQFSKIRERQVLKASVADVISSIDKARSQTLASLNSSSYGVHFQSDKVIIFKGTVYASNDANNVSVNIVSPATISNVTLAGVSGSTGDVYFSRVYGVPNKTGTIIVGTSSYSQTITLSALGNSSSN